MRPYLAVLSARYRMLLQYRAAALAGIATQLFWGAIRLMIFAGFYASTTRDQPMTLEQVIVYVWLGQALFALLPWRSDAELAGIMRSGNVGYELLRPLDTYHLWYVRSIATLVGPTTLRAIPLTIVAAGLLPLVGLSDWALRPPPDLAAALLFAAAMAVTVLLSASVLMLVHISMMWTVAAEGANRLLPGVVWVLSGMVIPLPFFPAWLQPFLQVQPFRGIFDVPLRIYSGHLPPGAAMASIALSLGWTAGFIVVGRAIMQRGFRRIVVQGG